MNEDQLAGAAKELVGKAQGAAGDLLGDGKISAKGRTREVEGDVQNLYGQAKDTLRDVADEVPQYADEAYRKGRRYVRDGSRTVGANPIASLLVAGAAGFILGFLIHNRD